MTQWKNLRERFSRKKEKIEITIETKESWEVHWFRKSKTEMCPICKTETLFIPKELCGEIIQTDVKEINKLLENGKTHVRTTNENEQLICLASLKKMSEKS